MKIETSNTNLYKLFQIYPSAALVEYWITEIKFAGIGI